MSHLMAIVTVKLYYPIKNIDILLDLIFMETQMVISFLCCFDFGQIVKKMAGRIKRKISRNAKLVWWSSKVQIDNSSKTHGSQITIGERIVEQSIKD